jgi:hypothetical protein
MRQLMAGAESAGSSVELSVLKANTRTRTFYERLGFRAVGQSYVSRTASLATKYAHGPRRAITLIAREASRWVCPLRGGAVRASATYHGALGGHFSEAMGACTTMPARLTKGSTCLFWLLLSGAALFPAGAAAQASTLIALSRTARAAGKVERAATSRAVVSVRSKLAHAERRVSKALAQRRLRAVMSAPPQTERAIEDILHALLDIIADLSPPQELDAPEAEEGLVSTQPSAANIVNADIAFEQLPTQAPEADSLEPVLDASQVLQSPRFLAWLQHHALPGAFARLLASDNNVVLRGETDWQLATLAAQTSCELALHNAASDP